jgi:hypothetical protein
MQYEENLNPNIAKTESQTTPALEQGTAQLGRWLSRIGQYRRGIGNVVWLILLLCTPLMLFSEAPPIILILWVGLLFITPFFVLSGLMKAQQFGLLLLSTLLLAVPFLILNAMIHAHHMMTLGSAGLTQTEIPLEQMRVLWLSLVAGDTISFLAVTIASLIIFTYACKAQQGGFIRHSLMQLVQLVVNIRFWIFAIAQVIIFALINSPDTPYKMIGMLLFGCSVLLLFFFQGRKISMPGKSLQQSAASKRFSIALVILSVPVLYVLLNGYVDYFALMLTDKASMNIVGWFEPGSPMPGFVAISTAKFMSQLLNLWPMCLLLCASLTIRGTSSR